MFNNYERAFLLLVEFFLSGGFTLQQLSKHWYF